jgi:glycosyltransferase involved in cell wall biosynthesis
VQEYALAGYPLVCSTTTSAATSFLTANENGFYCEPQNEASLKEAILKIINSDDDTLIAMMHKSHVKGNSNTPQKWSETLLKLINS